MYFTTDNIFLIASVLVFTAILVSRVNTKFGVPVLLLFMIVGMLFGSDGLGLVFDNYKFARFCGTAALAVILFAGGIETKFSDIKPVLRQGVVLSTFGVLFTMLFTGFFIYAMCRIVQFALPMPIIMCFLLAAVMSSTDSATVFSILRNNRMRLKNNLQPMLELESGSNDPMAYCLTVVLLEASTALFDPNAASAGVNHFSMIWNAIFTFSLQIFIGSLFGVAIGFGASLVLKRLRLNSAPLYAILLLSIAFFTISITEIFSGNGYLAVYVTGLIIGNRSFAYKKEILKFLDGMTWLMQIIMFLILGLLVNPKEMLSVAPIALLIGAFLMFFARPLSVFLCLLPFKNVERKDKLLISWVGLKGAAPIIFATYPIIAGIPGSNSIFNIVFCITLISMLLQGMTIPKVAEILHLDLPEKVKPDTFGMEIPEEAGKLINRTLTEEDLAEGDTLKEISLPEGARVLMVYREDKLIVPDGTLKLMSGDKLLIIYGYN